MTTMKQSFITTLIMTKVKQPFIITSKIESEAPRKISRSLISERFAAH